MRCQVAVFGCFEGDVDGVTLADELVQLERERGGPGGVADLRASQQQLAQPLFAGLGIDSGQRAEAGHG
jgi:hypothetical protein